MRAALTLIGMTLVLTACGGGGGDEDAFVEAERARATKYAAEIGRDCTPACRVFEVEPISPGLWRVHFNSATGSCALIYLDEYQPRDYFTEGRDLGVDSTNCIGEPRPRP